MKKPDNILVDYEYTGGCVSNFRCLLADFGSSGPGHPGGTPMYAGPKTYLVEEKDLFSFGRMTMELFLEPQGKMNTFE